VEGMSASKMRKAVVDNDFNSFRKGTPKTLDDADTQALFDAVRQGMSIKKTKVKKESFALWEIAPKYDMKNLRENYIRGKIFRIGDKVQNLNTGLIGEVMRRGTNHIICVTEEGYMYKSWIKDLMEYTEVKMDRMFRTPGKPNTLAGTTGYLKYAMKQTPGSTFGKENLQKGGNSFLDKFINKYRKSKVST
ncbi:MAG: cytidyltransferase, partial [Candidatus Nanopelagicales bacterium]